MTFNTSIVEVWANIGELLILANCLAPGFSERTCFKEIRQSNKARQLALYSGIYVLQENRDLPHMFANILLTYTHAQSKSTSLLGTLCKVISMNLYKITKIRYMPVTHKDTECTSFPLQSEAEGQNFSGESLAYI